MIFYDFEVFRYDWLVVLIDLNARKETVIINDPDKLKRFYEEHKGVIWAGYNSRNYDQYILKAILCGFDPKPVNDWIIVEDKPGYRYSSLFREYPLINYDVMPNPPISLKALEAFMGHSIKETSVPFDIDRPLTEAELAETVKYCRHDVEQTVEVWLRRKEDEFDAQMSLVKAFHLPISDIGRTKAQLSAKILGAVQREHNDEFEIEFPPSLRIEKYTEVLNWYKNPLNRDYSKTLELEVAGVPHVFAWGGLHGAIPKYHGEGWFVNVDVASYYPSLMLVYKWLSRNVHDPSKYAEIYHTRLKLKAEKNPMQQPYKIVLNSTYGAMKDKHNAMYDPRQANNVCVGGQLLLLDLIERLEDHCEIIQSNTDGILVKLRRYEDFEMLDDLCWEWEQRTGMRLEFECVAEFEARHRVVGDRDERHIEHRLAVEPAGFDRVFSKHDTGDDTERCRQHAGGVDCREPQTIDGKFQDQELIDQRHMDLVGDTDKSEPFRDPAGILHKKQPHRCQK